MNLEKSVKFLDMYLRSPLTSVMAQSAWSDIRAALEESQNTSTNTQSAQALRAIAADIECWIERVKQTKENIPVHLLVAWLRQLRTL